MVEIYKTKNKMNPPIMEFMFERGNNTYNLRNFQEFPMKRKRTIKMGLAILNYKSLQLWSISPENLRQMNWQRKFKENVRKWECVDGPCRLCKLYLPNIRFL